MGLARSRTLGLTCVMATAAAFGGASAASAASPPGLLAQLSGTAGCIVNAPTPVATCDNTGKALSGPTAVAVSADGESAYVASASSSAVAVFDRDTTTGALTQKAGAAGCIVDGPSTDVATCDNTGRALANPSSVAVSADGESAYVTAANTG